MFYGRAWLRASLRTILSSSSQTRATTPVTAALKARCAASLLPFSLTSSASSVCNKSSNSVSSTCKRLHWFRNKNHPIIYLDCYMQHGGLWVTRATRSVLNWYHFCVLFGYLKQGFYLFYSSTVWVFDSIFVLIPFGFIYHARTSYLSKLP